MNVKMLKTIQASKDKTGTSTKEYIINQEYNVYDELKKIFLQEGWAIELETQDLNNVDTSENNIEANIVELETQDLKVKENKKKKNKGE